MSVHIRRHTDHVRSDIDDGERSMRRSIKGPGIVIAVLMIILGALLMIWPITTGSTLAYIAAILFVLYGAYQIILFATTKSEYRNGWLLADGIIFAVLGVLLLFAGPIVSLETFVFLLAFFTLFGGINEIFSYGTLRRMETPRAGWVLASGIINVVLGIALIMLPFLSVFVVEIFIGIYLLIAGITFLIALLSGQYGRRA